MSIPLDNPPRMPKSTDDDAFGRFVPRQFLELLGRKHIADVELGDHVEKEMTLLFSDIRDFTALSESILPEENFRFINSYLSVMEPVVSRHQGIIDKYIGDGIMALFPGSADDGLRSGIDMLRRLVSYNDGRSRAGYQPIRIGIGINTGLVMMGTVGGHNRMDSTVIGEAVNFASRLETMTKVYGTPLIISEHTLHSLADPSAYCIRFLDRLTVKGRYQAQSVYEIFDSDPEPLWLAKQETRPLFEEALACYHLGHVERAVTLLQACMRIAPDDRVVHYYLERCRESYRQGFPQPGKVSIAEVAWREEYAVGIREIDRQHKELLRQIAILIELAGRDEEELDKGMTTLADFLSRHTETEDNLMRRYSYPFAEHHRQQHQHFMRSFADLRGEIQSAPTLTPVLLFRIQSILVDWQINHITKSDLHLGSFLQRAGI